MKQLFSLFICLGLLCCLSACTDSESPASVTTPEAQPESTATQSLPAAEPSSEAGAITAPALEAMAVNIAVIYPENTPEEGKANYGLQRLDEHYAPLDDTIYGDGESLSISAGELARFTPAAVAEFLPALHYTQGSVLAQELNNTVYITVLRADSGVMDITVDYTNTSWESRLHGPASEDPTSPAGSDEIGSPEPTADNNRPYTIRFLGCVYPDGHDAAADPGGLRVYTNPDDLSVYTDYTEALQLDLAADETFCYSILPTRANTSQGAGLHAAEAVLSDDLPRYLHRGNADLEIVYGVPGPISIGPARQDLHFTVEVIYPEGIAEEDKAACGIHQLDADMKLMEDRIYGHGDTFTVPYAHWAGFTPLQPEAAQFTYSSADAYTITSRDIPCTIFRSAESGEVTITVDYSQN